MSNIPKIIHYCWFGRNPYPELIIKCIQSWKTILPDYKIIEWNEDNFEISSNQYIEEAYRTKKWAFVSDYVRLYAIFTYGGVYFDTDVEILKPLDRFLSDKAFSGFESRDTVSTAMMGCQKEHSLIGEMMHYYDDKHFINKDGTFNTAPNVVIITKILSQYGLKLNGKFQIINYFVLYPQIYFCPNSFLRVFNRVSSKSYAIHHFDSSWKNRKSNQKTLTFRFKRYCTGVFRNIIGTKILVKIKGEY
jgi:mannosyltransferase OCH1-like enzyme